MRPEVLQVNSLYCCTITYQSKSMYKIDSDNMLTINL
jgi:hypothetical protein